MPMDSVCNENVEKINKDYEDKMLEYNILKTTTIEQMWHNDLDELRSEYNKYVIIRREEYLKENKSKYKKKK